MLEKEESKAAANDSKSERKGGRSIAAWLLMIGVFLVLVLVAPGIHPFQADRPTNSAPPTPAVPSRRVNAVQAAQCDKLIDQGKNLGLIRSRPQPQRIDVDEAIWNIMDLGERRGLMLALRCSAYRGAPGASDNAVAYGAKSGKQLSSVTRTGVSFN